MGTEIERKFLVAEPSVLAGRRGTPYRQGYLSLDPDRVVRVRVAGDHAYLTVKGRPVGLVRAEYEVELPADDAGALLDQVCLRPLIEKVRHEIDHAGHTWHVDEFGGENRGLVVAEIELSDEDEPFERPPWLGPEVSDDPRYLNASLVRHPYREWAADTPGPRAHSDTASR